MLNLVVKTSKQHMKSSPFRRRNQSLANRDIFHLRGVIPELLKVKLLDIC